MTITYDFGDGGFDVSFTTPVLSSGDYVRVECNSSFIAADRELASPYGYIDILFNGTNFEIATMDTSLDDIERMTVESGFFNQNGTNDIRVTAHNEFISVFANGKWVNTFWLKSVQHKEEPTVVLYGPSDIILVNVEYPELNDWRDAIFIDLEQTGMNAIGSVILSKPIDVYNKWDGRVCFSMNANSDDVEILYLRSAKYSESRNPQACSDGIVYFTDVAVVIDEQYLTDYGMSTKLIRLPDLTQGIKAAIKLQDRARRLQKGAEATSRFDPTLEMKDTAIYQSEFTSLNDPEFAISIEVDSMRISLSEVQFSMTVSGKEEE